MEAEKALQDPKAALNHTIATIGLGLLFVWWGVVLIVDPLTRGMGVIGTGLILLGINAMRLLKGIPINVSTLAVGTIALVWGTLDTVLDLAFWQSIAVLLILIGGVTMGTLLIRSKSA